KSFWQQKHSWLLHRGNHPEQGTCSAGGAEMMRQDRDVTGRGILDRLPQMISRVVMAGESRLLAGRAEVEPFFGSAMRRVRAVDFGNGSCHAATPKGFAG